MPHRNRAAVYSASADVFMDEEPTESLLADNPNHVFFPIMTIKLHDMYNRYCRSETNLFAIFPLMILCGIICIVRLNFQNRSMEPSFYVSHACFIMAGIGFHINTLPLVLRYVKSDYLKVADQIESMIARFPILLEDLTMLLMVGCFGFNLIARVLAGKCPDDISFWETQRCVPFVSSVPSDIVILLYIVPFVFIMFTAIKSVSIVALIFSWCLIIGFVMFSIVYNHAWSQIWELFLSSFFIAFTFMMERQKRIAFLRLVEVIEQKTKALKLQKIHMEESAIAEQRRLVEVASVTATNERKLRVAETQQLRSLMGNVAHDLKTPLFSMEADVELLQSIFNTIPSQYIQMALASG